MKKRKPARRQRKNVLDRTNVKRPGRGRPVKVSALETIARASNYRNMFWGARLDVKQEVYIRDKPHEWAIQLLASKDSLDAERALESSPYDARLRPLIPLILKVLNERSLPKKQETQLDFLADSLAGQGDVSARRSRDICAQERMRERRKSTHQILRYEYYVECTCGFRGPARDNACRKCGASIPLSLDMISGF